MNNFPAEEIERIVYDILKQSKSFNIFPTPVDDIVKYSELYLDTTTGIHSIPNHFISKKIDVLQRALRKVRGVLDRKEKIIYIDPTKTHSKKNFIKLHEVGHNMLPWQKATFDFIDDDYTLGQDVEDTYERQANYFASASLFQLDRYEEELLKLPLNIGSPIALADKFGGSYHASLMKYVDCSPKRCAVLVLDKPKGIILNPELDYMYHFQSGKFTTDFGKLSLPEKLGSEFPFINDYTLNKKIHQEGKVTLQTKNGIEKFNYHYFDNYYNVFILVMPLGEKQKVRTKILVK